MRAVCFHGRREIGGEDMFLRTARIFGAAAVRAGLSAQVRTPGFPSPAGSPDRAVVKIAKTQPADLAIPMEYDLEIVCDPHLAVVPPMGDALKRPGGVLVLNTPKRVESSRRIRLVAVDVDAIASRHGAAPEAAHLGAALAGWGETRWRICVRHVAGAYREIRGEPMGTAEERALAEAVSTAAGALRAP